MSHDRQTQNPPPARGVRLDWNDVPARVRAAVEQRLGSAVQAAESQPGGFSPGVAARVRLADGRRVFLKAAGPQPNPGLPAIHRQEGRVVAALPPETPAPRLLDVYDEGEGGWIALVFEDVDGRHPAQPWDAGELGRVLAAMDALSGLLTPSPLAEPVVPLARDAFRARLAGWRQLAQETPDQWTAELDPWSARRLDALAALEAQAAAAADGNTLLHFDTRADNILLARGRTWFVDWPLACVGAPWLDVVLMAPSVAMQGGPEPEALIAQSALCRAADPQAVTAVVAAAEGSLPTGRSSRRRPGCLLCGPFRLPRRKLPGAGWPPGPGCPRRDGFNVTGG